MTEFHSDHQDQISALVQPLIDGKTNKVVIDAPVRGGGYSFIVNKLLDAANIRHIEIRADQMFEHDFAPFPGTNASRTSSLHSYTEQYGLTSTDAVIIDYTLNEEIGYAPTIMLFEQEWMAAGGRIIHIAR